MRRYAQSFHRYREPSPEATALIIYTSGTTGAPKGVPVSRRAIAADLDALAAAWQWSPDDVLVHGLPLFHVHGLVLGLLGSLRVGNRFVHTGTPTPAGYAEAAAAGGTLFSGCPPCGHGWSPSPPRPARWARHGCWSAAPLRCRCRSSTGSPRSPVTSRSNATAAPNR